MQMDTQADGGREPVSTREAPGAPAPCPSGCPRPASPGPVAGPVRRPVVGPAWERTPLLLSMVLVVPPASGAPAGRLCPLQPAEAALWEPPHHSPGSAPMRVASRRQVSRAPNPGSFSSSCTGPPAGPRSSGRPSGLLELPPEGWRKGRPHAPPLAQCWLSSGLLPAPAHTPGDCPFLSST